MLSSQSLSKILRLGCAMLLLGYAVATGFSRRSLLCIFLLAVVFSVGYIAGKWHAWRTWRLQTMGTLIAQFLTVYLIQAALVLVLYLLGAGLTGVMGRNNFSELAMADFWLALMMMILTICSCAVFTRLENRNAELPADMAEVRLNPKPEIELLDAPITPKNFFRAKHYSHVGGDQSLGSDDKIALAEHKLKHDLPNSLRALYRIQNGGSLPILVIYKAGRPMTGNSEDVIFPFGGYNDLLPLESLLTLHDLFSEFADPIEEAERFPEGCAQQIVLAAWYRHILLLDYNVLDSFGEPGVMFTDFDDDNWRETAQRWPSFASFFAQLREMKD